MSHQRRMDSTANLPVSASVPAFTHPVGGHAIDPDRHRGADSGPSYDWEGLSHRR